MLFGEQLRKYRKQSHLTQNELAYRVEIITGETCKGKYISTYESGSDPKIGFIEAFAQVLNIPVQYLFDDSDGIKNKIIKNEIPLLEDMYENTIKIPIAGGFINRNNSDMYVYVDKYMIKKRDRNNSSLGAIIVLGDSMVPYTDNCDVVVFKEIEMLDAGFPDGKYVIETEQSVLVVKNLTFKTNGDIVVSSCNKDYKDSVIPDGLASDKIRILGMAIARLVKG